MTLWLAGMAIGLFALAHGAGFLTPASFVVLLAAFVALVRCRWWTPQQRGLAVLALLVPNLVLNEIVVRAHPAGATHGVLTAAAAAIHLGVVAWLWQARVRPAQGFADHRGPRNPWLRRIGVGVLIAVCVVVLVLAVGALWTFHDLSGNLSTAND